MARQLSCGAHGRLLRRPNQLKREVRDPATGQLLPGAKHPRVAVQDLGTWAKGCVAEAKSGRKAYEEVAVLHPYGAGRRGAAGDLVVRDLGQPKLAVGGRLLTMGLKEKLLKQKCATSIDRMLVKAVELKSLTAAAKALKLPKI